MPDSTQAETHSAPTVSFHGDHEMQNARMRAIEKTIWLITVIAGAISLLVIVSVVIIALVQIGVSRTTPDRLVMPEVLVNWGGIILGFFGSVVTLLKDFMSTSQTRELSRPTRSG